MTEPRPNVPSRHVHPLLQIALGCLIGIGAFAVPWACGASHREGELPRIVQCKLDALRVLPDDVGRITVYDAIDIYDRVRACHRAPEPDAEAP